MTSLPWLLLIGCQPAPTTLIDLNPEVAIAPPLLDFGDQAVPMPAELPFYVTNAGGAELEIAMTLDGDGRGAFELLEGGSLVPPNGQSELHVRFQPDTYLDFAAEIVVVTNDPNLQELRLPLRGSGVAAPLPDIDVAEGTIDWGEVTAPTTELLFVRNAGTADLHLGAMTLTGSGAFSLLSDPTDTTIAAGDTLPVVLSYDPNPEGDAGLLTIASDDPDEPTTTVVLLGNGGGDFAYPEAVIDCPGAVSPPTLVTLDGYGSNDPNGLLPLTWAWSLTGVPTDPSGRALSTSTLTGLSGPTADLFVDTVGIWTVDLAVTNAAGTRSAPARCVIQAIPTDLVMVELTWDTAYADLDLHMGLADAPFLAEPDTACWCSRRPDWGVIGTIADDPVLNLDDRSGFGPENISIDAPVEGEYDVRVHYYDDSGDTEVTATVRVYLNGDLQPAFQDSRLMRRDEVWDVGRIRWPEATVGAFSVANYTAPTRSCFTP